MALIDVIRFDGLKNRDWVIYKHPCEKLKLGTQLIVQEGQNAIFVKSGLVADVFHAGTHTLSTANLPILFGQGRNGNNLYPFLLDRSSGNSRFYRRNTLSLFK